MKTFNEFLQEGAIVKCVAVDINESSLSRVWRHVTKHDSGTISAFRYAADCGEGKVYSKADNMKRNAQLKAKLLANGYGVTPIDGVYIENFGSKNARNVREKSFLVVDLKDSGNLEKDLKGLGNAFEQDSITFSKPNGDYFLIGTNKCPNGYPGFGKREKLGKSMFGKKGEFHSAVKGRPFVFESMNNRLVSMDDLNPTEIRSIVELNKKGLDTETE